MKTLFFGKAEEGRKPVAVPRGHAARDRLYALINDDCRYTSNEKRNGAAIRTRGYDVLHNHPGACAQAVGGGGGGGGGQKDTQTEMMTLGHAT